MLDFDLAWRQILSARIEHRAGTAARYKILAGDTMASDPKNQLEVIVWTRQTLNRMESVLDTKTCRAVISDCACHYPDELLEPLRALYLYAGDLKQVHSALQGQFETFLREYLGLDPAMIADVITRRWGVAGILADGSIVATKIPKSGNLRDYLQECDPEVRRSIYCHCPRVRASIGKGETLLQLYCYCGAGFYKHLWETILEENVEVEVLESVLSGGQVCRVAINFPSRI